MPFGRPPGAVGTDGPIIQAGTLAAVAPAEPTEAPSLLPGEDLRDQAGQFEPPRPDVPRGARLALEPEVADGRHLGAAVGRGRVHDLAQLLEDVARRAARGRALGVHAPAGAQIGGGEHLGLAPEECFTAGERPAGLDGDGLPEITFVYSAYRSDTFTRVTRIFEWNGVQMVGHEQGP